MNDMNDKRKELQEKENERHQKYLDLLDSYLDEELDNMSYFDLVKNGLAEDCDMGA
jgi:beta-galactosidase beta subunit